MIENFDIIHSIQIGVREVVVGVSPEQEFMCCFCTQDGMWEYSAEAMASDDYLEIMALYADRLKGEVAALQAQRNTLHIPLELLGYEHCFPLLDGDDITGKVVAVKPDSLRYEYRRADCQLILVTNGSGARGYLRGASVYGVNVFTGRRAGRWERRDVLGEVRPECLPQWGKDHLKANYTKAIGYIQRAAKARPCTETAAELERKPGFTPSPPLRSTKSTSLLKQRMAGHSRFMK